MTEFKCLLVKLINDLKEDISKQETEVRKEEDINIVKERK